MSDGTKLRGRVTKLATVEILELVLELDDIARRRIETQPEQSIREFLESKGYKVNALRLDGFTPDGDVVKLRMGHVTTPSEIASQYGPAPEWPPLR